MLLLWYFKMIAAHLLTDFAFQPKSWVNGRIEHHYKSRHIYFHVLITAITAWLFDGFVHWAVPVVILFTHFGIDLWKSYRPQRIAYFLIDQGLHLLVIGVLGWLLYQPGLESLQVLSNVLHNEAYWAVVLAVIFLTHPSGILIGMLTTRWRVQLADSGNTLGAAGKWIGMLERLIIFILVVYDQYEAIGLLTAAKSILRFSESKDAPERSEYVLIGTLISISFALIIGLIIKIYLPVSS
ncbi:hypothetical protein ADIARSV_0252 [Arcticibacter svalbardensis MN12-7]|uniref:DUF3307 domain-containing protein n=1 Tax=Arcticibacter svalbardensis MN12-7 TaxID=1150600 RepID=R9GY01_9SPHI|nr:DUF3307 domain-containing protein [Arcticibacter svalbardensis]EOR96621.1 hypothetical protein ADIARSV_0252 [Arcticibacter svalbardensis MN12-7]